MFEIEWTLWNLEIGSFFFYIYIYILQYGHIILNIVNVKQNQADKGFISISLHQPGPLPDLTIILHVGTTLQWLVKTE